MSETATVLLTEALPPKSDKAPFAAKDGNGKIWKRWDAHFEPYIGKKVNLVYEDKSREYNGRTYTDSFVLEIEEEAPPAHQPASTETGDVDWDLIGLRKTRCHLWGAFMAGDAMQSLIAMQLRDKSDIKQSELVHNLLAAGRDLVRGAEIDIYHRDPAAAQEDVPF